MLEAAQCRCPSMRSRSSSTLLSTSVWVETTTPSPCSAITLRLISKLLLSRGLRVCFAIDLFRTSPFLTFYVPTLFEGLLRGFLRCLHSSFYNGLLSFLAFLLFLDISRFHGGDG